LVAEQKGTSAQQSLNNTDLKKIILNLALVIFIGV
jgi:hypothetical protein